MDATTYDTMSFGHGTAIARRPAAKQLFTKKNIGKVLRATARFYEENLDRWTRGFWRGKFQPINERCSVTGLRAAQIAQDWETAECFCAHGGVAKVAYDLELPSDPGEQFRPHQDIRNVLNENGLTTDWNDKQKDPLTVIAKLREIARKYR